MFNPLSVGRQLNESCNDSIQCSAINPNATCGKKSRVCECTEGLQAISNRCINGKRHACLIHTIFINLFYSWKHNISIVNNDNCHTLVKQLLYYSVRNKKSIILTVELKLFHRNCLNWLLKRLLTVDVTFREN